MVNKGREIINQGKIEQCGETTWKVADETVKLHKKTGRHFYSCSCRNFTRFCNSNTICCHIEAVIIFDSQDPRLKMQIREMKKHAEDSERLGISIDPSYLSCKADDLRRFI